MQFGILGSLEVTDDGGRVPVTGAGQRALLALLLLHANEVVSSDRLIDQLWDAEPPGSGVAALRVRVSQLRKALGRAGDRLETNPAGYLLRVGSGELDLDRFTRLWGKPTARSRPWLPRGSARRSRSGAARRWPISHTQALPS